MNASTDDIVKDLKINVDAGQYTISGRFEWSLAICEPEAPDQVQREVDKMGQVLKRQVYGEVLKEVDRRIVGQWQLANPALQKRGTRPFSFVTPFGTVEIRRIRLCNSKTKSWYVPSAVVWNTPHRKYIVPGLREAVCDRMNTDTVRQTNQQLSEQASEEKEKLLGNSTIVKIMHNEGSRLIEAQRERTQSILEAHPEAIEAGLASPPENELHETLAAESDSQVADSNLIDQEEPEELSPQEEQEVLRIAMGFLGDETNLDCESDVEALDVEQPSEISRSKGTPRQVEEGWVNLQVDEVTTKAQATNPGKETCTYTATVEFDQECHYFAEASADHLWCAVTALLCCLGVCTGGLQLLVLADGAGWIRKWFENLKLPGATMILCWFHLTKRVYQGLSSAGFSKDLRLEIQQQVLHYLWHGDLAAAVWYLWGIREQARTPQCISDLIRYLLRRRHYLPDYSARYAAGLWIASTRVEKWNDIAVSNRCKRRGMSWIDHGVLSIASHQAARKNGELETWRISGQLPVAESSEETADFALAA